MTYDTECPATPTIILLIFTALNIAVICYFPYKINLLSINFLSLGFLLGLLHHRFYHKA